jgi:hypothetical protein
VWDIITKNSDLDTMDFLLPSTCPGTEPHVCAIQAACKEVMTVHKPLRDSLVLMHLLLLPKFTSRRGSRMALQLSLRLEGVIGFKHKEKDSEGKISLIQTAWLVHLPFLVLKARVSKIFTPNLG